MDDKQIRDEFDQMVNSVLEEEKAGLGAAPVIPSRSSSTGKSVVKKPVTDAKAAPGPAKKKKKKKKKKKSAAQIIGSIVKTVFLVALLLCIVGIGLGAYMFIGFQGDKVTTDSVSKLIKQDPMPIDERFEINTSACTAKLRLDKADVWYLVQNQLGDEFIEEIKNKFNEKGLRLSAYGLIIDENGSRLDLDVRWNSFKIPTHVPVEIGFENGEITVKPQSVRLLKFNISPKLLKMLAKVDLNSVSYSVKPEPFGIIKSFDSMSVEDENLVFGCTLNPDILAALEPETLIPINALRYMEGYADMISAAESYRSDGKAAFTALLKAAEEKEGELERIFSEYYTLSLNRDAVAKMSDAENFMFDRVLAESTKESFIDANTKLIDFCEKRSALMDELGTRLYEAWSGSKISLDSNGFYYKKADLDITAFSSEENPWDNYELFVPQEGFGFVLVNDVKAYNDKTPALKKLAKKNTVYSVEEFDNSVAYQLGYVTMTANGHCFLSYMSSENQIAEDGTESLALKPVYVTLSAEEYNALRTVNEEEPKIIVYTGETAPEEP